MSALHGQCLCGAVTVTVTGAHESAIGACHCRMCQRWTGGLFLCFTANGVTFDGPVTRFRSSSFSERGFCATCGTHLFFHDDDEADDHFELMPGLFDATRDWPLRSEIYTDRRMTAVHLAGDHPRKSRADYERDNPFVEGDTP